VGSGFDTNDPFYARPRMLRGRRIPADKSKNLWKSVYSVKSVVYGFLELRVS